MVTELRFGWGGLTGSIIRGGPLATRGSDDGTHPYRNGSGALTDRAQFKGHEVASDERHWRAGEKNRRGASGGRSREGDRERELHRRSRRRQPRHGRAGDGVRGRIRL